MKLMTLGEKVTFNVKLLLLYELQKDNTGKTVAKGTQHRGLYNGQHIALSHSNFKNNYQHNQLKSIINK